MGGLIYSAFAFSMFYRSLAHIDRAYAFGSSGGSGWQRLFEGTSWQRVFDGKAKGGYDVLGGDSTESSGRTSEEMEMESDLEASRAKEMCVSVSNRS